MQKDPQDERYPDTPDDEVGQHHAGDLNKITPDDQPENEELSDTSVEHTLDIDAAILQRLEGIDMFSDAPGDEEEIPELTAARQGSPGDDRENGLRGSIQTDSTHAEKLSDEAQEFSQDTTISDRLSDLRMLMVGESESDEMREIPAHETTDKTLIIKADIETENIKTTFFEDDAAEFSEKNASHEISSSEEDDLNKKGKNEEVPLEILEAINEMDLDQDQLAAMDEVRKEMIDEFQTSTRSDLEQDDQLEISSLDRYEYAEDGGSKLRFTKRTLLWIILVLLIAASVVLAGVLINELGPAAPTPISTQIVLELPDDVSGDKRIRPIGLQFLGSWDFKLETGYVVDGIWEPKTAEWLRGTQLRRIIAIPWSKQLDSIIATMEPGTTIELAMSNDDTIIYIVQGVERVPRTQVDVFSGNTPALIIIVFQPDSDERIVITCAP
ncbi:MAG: hypothetical protein MUO76_21720 [Anaerolineaceae bacterium]|nr:hypothetical protein [Anaerolineaceae bacterium]